MIQSHCKSDRQWVQINELNKDAVGTKKWIRCRVHASRMQGAQMCFVELRQRMASVQALTMGKEFAAFAGALPKESVVDVFGEIKQAVDGDGKPMEIKSCTQSNVEIAVEKMFCVAAARTDMPFQLVDAGRTDAEVKRMLAEDPNTPIPDVGMDLRLNNRVLDLRTPANQGIFRIQSGVCQLFREILHKNGFTEIHSPKLIPTASEGGADVFKLTNYFDKEAYLAQSPQLYKQMALMGDLDRVFEIGPVFRSEKSFTHRHLCEFTGCDMEMCFNDHYHEVLDMLDKLFNYIFDGLNQRYGEEVESVRAQHPFEDLKYQYPCLKLTYAEGVRLLKEGGPAILDERIAVETCPETKKRMLAHKESIAKHEEHEDISTEDERLMGEVIKRKYNQEFYMIDKFPLHIRPFYSMPDPQSWADFKAGKIREDQIVANSYDIFIRGEEVTSGAQRIHNSDLLLQMGERCGVDLTPIQDYVDSFKLGANPHAGGGIGLERVVMLFLGLGNIRKSSLFPRDPKRITP